MRLPELDQFRARQIERLAGNELDVLVIGGGIVGAGVARDAALRGLIVGLVEQHDLAFGTSSRTSRLLHGGIRYLAQGRIGLVREASREKQIIHRIAPHLAQPLAFVFPTYRRSGWPLWKLRLGVKLYDRLCAGRNLGPSSVMRRDDVMRRLPSPKAKALTGAVRYYDGLTNDSRLVLDTLRSAAVRGATILNYARAEDAERNGPIWQCHVQESIDKRSCQISAKCIVHATGPWAEVLPQSSIRLRLTKGVHLVIDRGRLRVPDAVVMTEGKRILFAIPWGDRVILGTTDTDYSGPLDHVVTESDDVDYILDVVNGAFPDARLHRGDVVGNWAGLRPLIAQSHGGPSDISRSHKIREPEPGWIDVSGGKLTTYRRIAQDVVDRIYRHLGQSSPPCRTADLSLLEMDIDETTSGILPPAVQEDVVAHYCTNEWAVHLEDVMTRRTSWRYYHRNDEQIAEQVAEWMGRIFGWDYARHSDELAQYRGLEG